MDPSDVFVALDGVVWPGNSAIVSCVSSVVTATDAVTISSITGAVPGIGGSAEPSDGEPSGLSSVTIVRVVLDRVAGSAVVAVASNCAAAGRCEGVSSRCADSVDAGSAAAWLVVGLRPLPVAVASAAPSAVAPAWHITAPWRENAPPPHCEHVLCPDTDWYFPTAHSRQTEAALSG